MTELKEPRREADDLAALKQVARTWFEALRDSICAAFERLEDDLPAGAPLADRARDASCARHGSGPITGAPGGGGVMSLMHGRVFEKVGRPHLDRARRVRARVRASRSPAPRRTRASGPPASRSSPIRVNPNVPAAHMNTRMVVTSKWWFGGGADLTPVLDAPAHAGRRRHARLPRRDARRPARRTPSPTTRASRHGATSTSTCRIAARCAASAASSTTT